MSNALNDIKEGKVYILGVIGFTTAVTGFLVGVFNVDPVKTTIATVSTALVALFLGWLVHRAEKRSEAALQAHIKSSEEMMGKYTEDLKYLKTMALENQRSSIRIEMNAIIRNEPHNHDTILAYAEKYFVELDGDWKETDIFFRWISNEQKAGREVFIPPQLKDSVYYKREIEHQTVDK